MSEELKWIILKNQEILGPFTTSQIITNIYEGKYRPNDKVSLKVSKRTNVTDENNGSFHHLLNWRNLNEVSEFAIFRGNVQEDTFVNEEECTDPGDDFTEPSFDDIKITDVSYKGGSIASSKDRYYKVTSKKSKLFINITLVLIAIISLVFAVHNRMVKISNEGKDWYQTGVSQIAIGNYNKALTSLREAYKGSSADTDVAFSYSEVLIENGQLNKSLEILDKIIDPSLEQRKLNLLGLIHLKRKNLHEAKGLFNKALDRDPSYIPALINSGIANLHLFQYTNSHSKFELAYRSGSRDPILIMSKFLVAVNLFEQTRNTTMLQYMKRILASALTYQSGYKIHYHLALSYLEFLLGNTTAATKWFKNIMVLDADLEPSDFSYNLAIFQDHLNWSTMYELSMKFYDSLIKDPRVEATKGVLLLKTKNYAEASQTISNAMLRNSEDMGIRLLYAYLKLNTGVLSEAKANIEIASDTDFPVLVLLKSKLCDEIEENCLLFFEEMSQTDHYKLQGIVGLAKHFINAKQYTKANSLINTGLKISKSYIPLIMLNTKLENAAQTKSE